MGIANSAKDARFDRLSDSELELRLHEAARALESGDRRQEIAAALGAVVVAVRRRLGLWQALTADSSSLTSLPKRAAEVLAEVQDRLRTEHHTDVRLESVFYHSLEMYDDDDILRFEPTDGQIAAAALLLGGTVVEMDAGEGKTLSAGMAAAVFAASGRKVQVLTANDYLAMRDCETLVPVLESLGISVGLVVGNMDRDERRLQYSAQVVFTTAREVGFDYLRDCTAESLEHRVNPSFDVAIVDEADHQLLDQARTPLIISGEPSQTSDLTEDTQSIALEIIDIQTDLVETLYSRLEAAGTATRRLAATVLLAGGLTPRLVEVLDRMGLSSRQVVADQLRLNDEDEGRPLEGDLLFAVEAESQELRLTEAGWSFVLERLDSPGEAYSLLQTLRARIVHNPDTDYVVGPDEITLVDRLDGRPMISHRFMHGLHEALEVKEGLEGVSRTDAKAMTTIHAVVSNYRTVSGLTGTATEESDTFERYYKASTVRVPPESMSKRKDLGTEVYFDRGAHEETVVAEVMSWHRSGSPVLLTLGTVGESERFSRALDANGISHRVLNATNAAAEPEIVQAAGRRGAVTVSTGMAGRGTDIVVDDDIEGGLVVIIASLPSSARAERQIRGRTGRQGRHGTSRLCAYLGDPMLAFARQQSDLLRLRSRCDEMVSGPRVERLLRQVQDESTDRSRAITATSAEFAAVIEVESRAYYSERSRLFASDQPADLIEHAAHRWVERRTGYLHEPRTAYTTRFSIVSDGLWHYYGIDIGALGALAPSEIQDAVANEVGRRLAVHRGRVGSKRFVLAYCQTCLRAADTLWPDRLIELQDMVLSAALRVASHGEAIAGLSEQAVTTRPTFWTDVEDAAVGELLTAEHVADAGRIVDNQVEELPSELAALIR